MNQTIHRHKMYLSFLTISLFLVGIFIYNCLSIPSNSIWNDQILAINLAKDILEGNFPLVGYLHSNGMHSFPAFYYFITPLVYISENPKFLYWSVAIINAIGVILVSIYIQKKFGFKEHVIYLLFSGTHVLTMFYSSFFWNPNYTPFFMSLFLITFFKILEKRSVIYFHTAGILINIIIQMLPQSIVLIPSFIFILFIFRKLPNPFNQLVHLCIQLALVYPWIHYHLFIFDWNNLESGQKLYKGFSIAIEQYLNYLGGWVLNSEYTTYLNYGTNTYPYANIIDPLLKGTSIILLILITYSTYYSFKNIKIQNYINFCVIDNGEDQLTTKKYLIVLSIINLSCILFFLGGLYMEPHHYQFLSPVLALNMTLLVNVEKKNKKILLSALYIFIFIQGLFSYWRAFSEYNKPYVTDIGYSTKFLDYLNKNCVPGTSVYILDHRGLRFFRDASGGNVEKNCGDLILVLRDHYAQSQIIRWFLEKKYSKTDLEFKDYMIWTPVKHL